MAYCFVCKKDVDKYHLITRQETRVVKGVKVRAPVAYALCDECNNPIDLREVSENNEKLIFEKYHETLRQGKDGEEDPK